MKEKKRQSEVFRKLNLLSEKKKQELVPVITEYMLARHKLESLVDFEYNLSIGNIDAECG